LEAKLSDYRFKIRHLEAIMSLHRLRFPILKANNRFIVSIFSTSIDNVTSSAVVVVVYSSSFWTPNIFNKGEGVLYSDLGGVAPTGKNRAILKMNPICHSHAPRPIYIVNPPPPLLNKYPPQFI